MSCFYFFFTDPATSAIYTLSLHDALPIWEWRRGISESRPSAAPRRFPSAESRPGAASRSAEGNRLRSEEHTSELQSRGHLVCRLLLEKKKQTTLNNLYPCCTCKRSTIVL